MATMKQKLAVKKIMEKRGSVSAVMREVGYDEDTAKNPKNLTESKGYQELLNEYLPDDLILGALKDDIEKKPQNRTPELTLATKIKGMIVERKDLTTKGEKIESNKIIFENFTDATES